MKKLIALVALVMMLMIGAANMATAQNDVVASDQVEQNDEGLHKVIKNKFIEGGAIFMSFVLVCLILGLAFAIERILYLGFSGVNKKKFVKKIEDALQNGGVEEAKEIARNTRGPIASIYYQGLDRYDEGVDMVEKTVVSYGGVQMGLLEKGLSWIGLFIALAPMLGFMGTVIGMIEAFDKIQSAGNISATVVAGGIKIALITTVSGLIVAIILQVFYNIILSMIDNQVNDMEDASVSLLDLIVHNKAKRA